MFQLKGNVDRVEIYVYIYIYCIIVCIYMSSFLPSKNKLRSAQGMPCFFLHHFQWLHGEVGVFFVRIC